MVAPRLLITLNVERWALESESALAKLCARKQIASSPVIQSRASRTLRDVIMEVCTSVGEETEGALT